jgi:hypothetical protein
MQYVEIYSGPEYSIHYRFSSILNTVFVTAMYGTALPILFPIGLMAFVILYVWERVLICYYYKQPPMFSEVMTRSAYKSLSYAPLVYIMMTFWYLGNNQVYENLTFPIKTADEVVKSGHTVAYELANLKWDQSLPPFVMSVIMLIMLPFGFVAKKIF